MTIAAMSEADASFVLAFAMAGVAAMLLVVFFVLLPRAKAQALRASLQAAGVRTVRAESERAADGSTVFRAWTVPVPDRSLQTILGDAAKAKIGLAVQVDPSGNLSLQGRRARFWNVNHVDPLDFSTAKIAIQNASATETTLVAGVSFSGYWRAVLVVGCFTGWGMFILWLISRYRPGSVGYGLVLAGLGLFFLAVRYYAQLQRTGAFLDGLVLEAVRRAPRPAGSPA